jgi:hypothetical protein
MKQIPLRRFGREEISWDNKREWCERRLDEYEILHFNRKKPRELIIKYKTKVYLLRSDGEEGAWCGVGRGHFEHFGNHLGKNKYILFLTNLPRYNDKVFLLNEKEAFFYKLKG